MKVKLLRDTKPFGRTGEIVEVSPAEYNFLTSVGVAEPVKVEKTTKKGTRKK